MVTTFRSALFASALALVVPAQARDFRSSDVHPGDYPTVEAVKQMGNALKEESKGRHGVRVYANGALGNERDTLEQLKIGDAALRGEADCECFKRALNRVRIEEVLRPCEVHGSSVPAERMGQGQPQRRLCTNRLVQCQRARSPERERHCPARNVGPI
jgi:extracellular solute-binding protein (family 7)